MTTAQENQVYTLGEGIEWFKQKFNSLFTRGNELSKKIYGMNDRISNLEELNQMRKSILDNIFEKTITKKKLPRSYN